MSRHCSSLVKLRLSHSVWQNTQDGNWSLFITFRYAYYITVLFFLKRTSSSKTVLDMRMRMLFMTIPAQLNSRTRSDAALAGRGVFNRTNSYFSSDRQVDRHAVASELHCRYCDKVWSHPQRVTQGSTPSALHGFHCAVSSIQHSCGGSCFTLTDGIILRCRHGCKTIRCHRPIKPSQ